MSKVLGKKTMATVGVMHSFLNEQELNRDEENFQNHICIRFIRKKFKCLIIFFLSICPCNIPAAAASEYVIKQCLLLLFDLVLFRLLLL